ncbi:MAG: anaerobic glycerol-3-phosphate dehydrogenase subunit C [Planctomycetota bacterium]
MDPERERIQADLSGQLTGEIRCDDVFLQMYATDASIYEMRPLAVVRPESVDDVVACLRYARDNNIPVFPRGAGSNVAGSCLGPGIVLDFSYGMRRMIRIDRETVTVEAGMVLAELNRELASHDRIFAPDPATRSMTTIGGVLSMNSTGSHWASSGAPRDKVVSMEVVTADGQQITVNSARNSTGLGLPPTGGPSTEARNAARNLSFRISRIVQSNSSLIEASLPATPINQAGYHLSDICGDDKTDLARLIVGSEGTLGIITSATLLTDPIPRCRGVALLFFHRLESAANAAVEIARMGAAACDLLDRRLLTLARESRREFNRLIPQEAEAMLLVEFQTSEIGKLRDKLDHLQTRIQRRKKLAFDIRTTLELSERNLYWRMTRRVIPSLFRLQGSQRALPFVDDIAIAPEKLPAFIKQLHETLHEHDVTASIFSHTPQGLVMLRPFLNLSDSDDRQKMFRLADRLFELVTEAGGTISGAHGDGMVRTWFLRRQYGRLYNVFSEIKNTFDPQNILNPGKIVGHPYNGLTDHLRNVSLATRFIEGQSPPDLSEMDDEDEETSPDAPSENKDKAEAEIGDVDSTALPVVEPQLDWVLPEIALAARNCNGCARCRTTNNVERMCPVFRIAPREEASPRAKANLMRSILSGELDTQSIGEKEFKEVADLCINCHQCRLECPAGVDIPRLMVEAKAQHLAINGTKISDWLMMRMDKFYEFASRMPRVTNRLMRNKTARWFLDRVFGIAQGRKLPSFAPTNFLRWANRQRLSELSSQTSGKVAYFVDSYANFNDIELGQAFVKVLQHNGIDVHVPQAQSMSGISLLTDGVITRAKKIAARNVEMLAELVRNGYRIVTTEPSAALALTHEYLALMDDSDSRLVAENTVDAMHYLLELHEAGNLKLKFNPLNFSIGYHLPCHQRALMEQGVESAPPALKLLQMVAGLQVELIQKGCSGMAGTYGLRSRNYNRSLRMGLPLITAMRSPDIVAGTTECSTCKIQMEQGTTKPTIHPVKILALAYGLMPELEDLFNRRSEELVVT